MIKAVIFDCFGVLLANPYQERLTIIESEDPDRASEIRAINRTADKGILSREEAAMYLEDLMGVEAKDLLEEQDRREVRNEALLSYIETLKPSYKLAVMSNVSSRDRMGIRFKPGQLDSLFNTIVASGDVGHVKPDPEIYKLTAMRLGVEPHECVFIDDISEFCEAARHVGMKSIHFQTTEQCIEELNTLLTVLVKQIKV